MKRKLLIGTSLALSLCAVLTMASCNKDEGAPAAPAVTDTVVEDVVPGGVTVVATTDLGVSVEEACANVEAAGRTPVVITVYDETQADGAVLSLGEATGDYEAVCVNDLSIKDKVLAMPVAPRVLPAESYTTKIQANAGDMAGMLDEYYGTSYVLDADSDSEVERVAGWIASTGYTAEDMFNDYVAMGIVPVPTTTMMPEVLDSTNCTYEEVDGGLKITKYNGTSQNIVIPSEIDGKPVTVIGTNAFLQNNIHAVTTCANLTTIEANAFANAYGVFDVTFSDTVINIGENAFAKLLFKETNGDYVVFADVVALEYTGSENAVTIPDGIKYVGAGLFTGKKALTSVTFPEGVVAIGDKAFYECEALANVTLPEGLLRVGANAFARARAFTSVTLPASLVEVGDGAFLDCSNAVSVVLNDGLKKIGARAFEYCMYREDGSLSVTLNIPASVEYLGAGAFQKCNGITGITGGTGITMMGADAFLETPWLVAESAGKDFTFFNGILINCTAKGDDVVLPAEVKGIAVKMSLATAKTITVNDGCTFICNEAFKSCGSITTVTIPASVETIGEAILDGAKASSITVVCEAGSAAHDYASENLFKIG